MKILHTSDWHLGHRLYEQSQHEEQLLFLQWLKQCVVDNQIDVLLVAGDIFDTSVPSTQSQKLYYDFLISMRDTDCKQIILTAGNHDAPGTINAPKELLQALSIRVVGKSTENIKDEVFVIESGEEKIIVAAVPYLRDQDIRRAVAGESFDEIGDRYQKALTTHYQEVADYCVSINDSDVPVIATGHLFAIGGQPSDSEQRIYVGNLGDIRGSDFPAYFDYVALGHLHRPQDIDKHGKIRYSGSPYILSFSEVGYHKQVVLIETDKNTVVDVAWKKVPQFRPVVKIQGSFESCVFELNRVNANEYQLIPWVEVVLDMTDPQGDEYQRMYQEAEALDLELLKVTFANVRGNTGLNDLENKVHNLKELKPIEVFKQKCEEMNYNLENHPEVLDAFNEILQIVSEN